MFENIAGIGNTLIGFLVIIFSALFVAAIVGFIIYIALRERRYSEFTVYVLDKNKRIRMDKAGIFVDKKTNNKRFFMKKAAVGLDPNNVPYILAQKNKVAFVYQIGLKNFQFINLNNFLERLGNKEKGTVIEVGEEDVNWAINAYERQKKTFSNNALLQYLPYMIFAFVTIVILIMIIYVLRQFETIKDVVEIMKEIAIANAQAKTGTIVMQ